MMTMTWMCVNFRSFFFFFFYQHLIGLYVFTTPTSRGVFMRIRWATMWAALAGETSSKLRYITQK
jgi:hypothetical protein